MRAYKFLCAKWALDDLEKKRLKIATFDDLNDPFELLLFDMSDPELRKRWMKLKEAWGQKVGILCFSRNWRNPILWSHYAEKHRGICLGFDLQDEYAEKVKYRKTRLVNIDINYLKSLSKNDRMNLDRELLRTKYLGWEYEDEVRVSPDLNFRDGSHYYYMFDDKIKLKEVIAGYLCTEEHRSKIEELTANYADAIEVIQARLAFRSFKVVKDKRGFRTAH